MAVEICTRPWIVEPSRNSWIAFDAISLDKSKTSEKAMVSCQLLSVGQNGMGELVRIPILSLKRGH